MHTFASLTLSYLSAEAFVSHANDRGDVYFLPIGMKTRENNFYQRLGLVRKFCTRLRTQI